MKSLRFPMTSFAAVALANAASSASLVAKVITLARGFGVFGVLAGPAPEDVLGAAGAGVFATAGIFGAAGAGVPFVDGTFFAGVDIDCLQ